MDEEVKNEGVAKAMETPDLAFYMQAVIERLEADRKRAAVHTYTYAYIRKTYKKIMKSMNQYLIGISLCVALFLAGGCSNENDITGDGGDNGNPVPLIVRATAGSFDGVPETGKSHAPQTRTPTGCYYSLNVPARRP